MSLLEIDMVSKIYSRRRHGFIKTTSKDNDVQTIRALDKFSLTMENGCSTGVIGESGAGKTTLARIAAGIEAPSSGAALIDGEATTGRDRGGKKLLARTVQMIWQDAPGCLDPRRKVSRTIAEPLIIHGHAGKDRDMINNQVMKLLCEVGLSVDYSDRYPYQLSGGEAQRVVIARALALDPGLLICDEPASALDIRSKVSFAMLLARLRRERNLALLVVTHDLSLIRWLADEVIVLRDGQMVERDSTRNILSHPKNPYTKKLIESEPRLRRVQYDDTSEKDETRGRHNRAH
ncbi:MAG: ABC transporter ATP-binding protein [Thermoleophilia bacterium]